jgi:hypothetical protein
MINISFVKNIVSLFTVFTTRLAYSYVLFGQGSRQNLFRLRPRGALNQFKVQALDVVPTQTCVLFT